MSPGKMEQDIILAMFSINERLGGLSAGLSRQEILIKDCTQEMRDNIKRHEARIDTVDARLSSVEHHHMHVCPVHMEQIKNLQTTQVRMEQRVAEEKISLAKTTGNIHGMLKAWAMFSALGVSVLAFIGAYWGKIKTFLTYLGL